MYYIQYLLHGCVVLLAVTTVGYDALHYRVPPPISIYFGFQVFGPLPAILVLFSCSRLPHHFEAHQLSTSTLHIFEAIITTDPDVHTWSYSHFLIISKPANSRLRHCTYSKPSSLLIPMSILGARAGLTHNDLWAQINIK